jgi:hypothetical protein
MKPAFIDPVSVALVINTAAVSFFLLLGCLIFSGGQWSRLFENIGNTYGIAIISGIILTIINRNPATSDGAGAGAGAGAGDDDDDDDDTSSAVHCYGVNTNGTPMANGSVDIMGHPYGIE